MKDEENESNKVELNQAQITMLVDAYKEASSNYDKHILYVSTGALVVCTSYINSIIPLKEARLICIYYSGLTLLMIAIILCLVGLYISAKRIGDLISEFNFEKRIDHNEWINITVLVCTVIGLILLSIFSIINLV